MIEPTSGGDPMEHSNIATIIASILGAVGTFVAAVFGAIGLYRKGKADANRVNADARKVEVETNTRESKVTTAEAAAQQKRRQEQSDWAVEQAWDAYDKLTERVDRALEKTEVAVAAEARCRVLLATAYVELRELQKIAGIDRSNPELDEWYTEVLREHNALKKDRDKATPRGRDDAKQD